MHDSWWIVRKHVWTSTIVLLKRKTNMAFTIGKRATARAVTRTAHRNDSSQMQGWLNIWNDFPSFRIFIELLDGTYIFNLTISLKNEIIYSGLPHHMINRIVCKLIELNWTRTFVESFDRKILHKLKMIHSKKTSRGITLCLRRHPHSIHRHSAVRTGQELETVRGIRHAYIRRTPSKETNMKRN